MSQGKFIVIEGGEGVGKTTQVELLKKRIEGLGKHVEFVREPGGDELAEKIRELVLSADLDRQPETEVLLFNAARAQTINKVRQLLDEGNVVLSDRSSLSTVVYQGYGQGLSLDSVRTICEFATAKAKPDLVILLDAPLSATASRRQQRAISDRFEAMNDSFHQKIRDGYLTEAKAQNIPVVDASPGVETVQEAIWQTVEPLLH